MSEKKKDQTNPESNDQNSSDSSLQSEEESNYSQKNENQEIQMCIYNNAEIEKTSKHHKTKESKSEEIKSLKESQIQQEHNQIFHHMNADDIKDNIRREEVSIKKELLETVEEFGKRTNVVQNYMVLSGQNDHTIEERNFNPWDRDQLLLNQLEGEFSSSEESYYRNPHDDSSAPTSEDSSMIHEENSFEESYNNEE